MIEETYNEEVLALIHRTWCKTKKQTTMLEETIPKETNHECDTLKNFGIFFLGMKHALKQTQSELLTSPAKNMEMRSSELCKNCRNYPSLLLQVH